MAALRPLSRGERQRIGEYALQHGRVLGFSNVLADHDGHIGSPLIRLPLLSRLEARGTISAAEAGAGERFHGLFRIAALDALRAASMERRTPGGTAPGDLSPAGERCRRRVSDAMTALGGAGSPAGGAIWHVCGLEWSVRQWAITARRPNEQCSGILIGALAALAAHFSGGRR
jgi:hypothetical protein